MARAKGINAHKIFKLGKAPAERDKRNLRFASLLRAAAPALPSGYDFDIAHTGIPTPMFGNDTHGDCVIAGRAHQTLRIRRYRAGIGSDDLGQRRTQRVLQGDRGARYRLIVLESLKEWRHRGWRVGKRNYKIQAFAEVDRKNHDEVRQAIFADVGIGLGVQLPNSAKAQIQTGQPWDVTTGPEFQTRVVGRPLRLREWIYA